MRLQTPESLTALPFEQLVKRLESTDMVVRNIHRLSENLGTKDGPKALYIKPGDVSELDEYGALKRNGSYRREWIFPALNRVEQRHQYIIDNLLEGKIKEDEELFREGEMRGEYTPSEVRRAEEIRNHVKEKYLPVKPIEEVKEEIAKEGIPGRALKERVGLQSVTVEGIKLSGLTPKQVKITEMFSARKDPNNAITYRQLGIEVLGEERVGQMSDREVVKNLSPDVSRVRRVMEAAKLPVVNRSEELHEKGKKAGRPAYYLKIPEKPTRAVPEEVTEKKSEASSAI